MKYTNRQIEILKAASKLIGERGLQNLTTKNLAEEMGFTEPALYRHFKNKTEILSSMLSFYKSELQEGIKRIISDENLSGLEKLEEIMSFQFNHFENNPEIVMVIFAETSFQYSDTLSQMVLSILTHKKMMVEKIMAMGQKDGSIRTDISPSYVSVFYMGSMRFTILKWRLEKCSFSLIEEGENLWEAAYKLIGTGKV